MKYLRAYAIVYLIFLYLPILLLPLFAFNDSTIIAFPLTGMTTKWFSDLATDTALHSATYNSLLIALVTAGIATFFGVLAARANARFRYKGKKPITGIIMLPLVLPEIIVGISLLVVLTQLLKWDLSIWTVVCAHVLICTPFSIAILNTSFQNLDYSLEEAAIDLGETRLSTFKRITFPLIMPGIISSALIAFTISLDEFIIAFFLSGSEPTLPVYIWGLLRFPRKLPVVMALGALLVAASIILLIIAEIFRRRGLAKIGLKNDAGVL